MLWWNVVGKAMVTKESKAEKGLQDALVNSLGVAAAHSHIYLLSCYYTYLVELLRFGRGEVKLDFLLQGVFQLR